MNRKFGIILIGIIVLSLSFSIIEAQESGTIQATATVVSSLQVIGINNLNFSTVTPGIGKTIDKADVGFAGEWQVQGTPSSQLAVDFTIPNTLTLADSSATMIISFVSTDAAYDDETGGGQTSPAGNLDPNGQSILNLGVGGTLDVWIGGKVQPTVAQTGGDYSADIILTVAYTGN